jgi:hypothetical protein
MSQHLSMKNIMYQPTTQVSWFVHFYFISLSAVVQITHATATCMPAPYIHKSICCIGTFNIYNPSFSSRQIPFRTYRCTNHSNVKKKTTYLLCIKLYCLVFSILWALVSLPGNHKYIHGIQITLFYWFISVSCMKWLPCGTTAIIVI